MTENILNSARFQSEHQNLGYISNSVDSRLANFSTRYSLFDAASATTGYTTQWSESEGERIQDNNSVIIQFNGNILPVLDVSTEGGFNKNKNYQSKRTLHNWNYRLSFDGKVTRTLRAGISWQYRFSRVLHQGQTSENNHVSLDFNWRITPKILFNNRTNFSWESVVNVSQHNSLNWNILPRLNTGYQVSSVTRDENLESIRHNLFSNYKLFNRGHVFCRYNYSTSGNEPENTLKSYQAGLRMGF